MRPHILRALLNKEFHRHVANRGGFVLALLLVAAAVMLSLFSPSAKSDSNDGTNFVGGIHHCYVEYNKRTAFVESIQQNVDPALWEKVLFRERQPDAIRGLTTYEPGTGSILITTNEDPQTGKPLINVSIWHPKEDKQAMAPYEAWFWKAAMKTLHSQAEQKTGKTLQSPDLSGDDLWAVRESFKALDQQSDGKIPQIKIDRTALGETPLDVRSVVATGMVVFSLYFTCVYLLPTLNCEERERGVLLAQALSPASPSEILMAKFLFYPTFGILLAAILAGIYKPSIITTAFFWLAVISVAASFLGIGMTIAALAKTQRAAFLGSMCYLLSVSIILFVCSVNSIPYVQFFTVEYHGPRILHGAVAGPVESRHWLHLMAEFGLAIVWLVVAAWCFRKRGWQ